MLTKVLVNFGKVKFAF